MPKIEKFRGDLNTKRIEALTAEIAPMLGKIERHVQFEGDQATIHRHDSTVGHTPLRPVSAELTIENRPLGAFTEEVLDGLLRKVAEQLAEGMSMNTFATMNEATAATGNVIDGQGQPLSEELILAAFDKMEHSFEPDGTWNPPTIVASPETVDRMMKANEDPEKARLFNSVLEKIVDRKRDDFRRREADRVLAG